MLNSGTAFEQNTSDEPFIASNDASGEETVREIEMLAEDAKKYGERLFVIARLGKTEKSHRISLARLAYSRAFLILTRKFPFQAPIFAEGERAEREGKIEFYLGSRLRLVILAKLNKIPNLTFCEDYFPPVKSTPRRKKRRS